MLHIKKNPIFQKLSFLLFGVGIIGMLGIVAATYYQHSEETTQDDLNMQTVPVENTNWVVQIQANGVVQAEKRVNLSSEDSGKITKLLINEGDTVAKGQIIALMSNERLQAQVSQYKALLLKAEAELARKISGNRPEEIAQAKARLERSQAELQQIISSTPEEVNQLETQVKTAQARLRLAGIRLKSHQMLVNEGALAAEKFYEVETEYKTTQASFEEVQKKLEQLQVSKREEIAQRQAGLEEAEQFLKQSKSGTRPQEITQAQAEVKQAKAQLEFYQSQLNNTVIRAPFTGIITRRFATDGDFISPSTAASASEGASSTSIAELSSGLEIEAKIPEANISKIKIGQQVEIKTDTFTDDVFVGKVKLIAPRAIQENNITSFRVKITLINGKDKLKSGMNTRLNFKSQPIKNALVIPLAAVVTQPDGKTGVYVPDENSKTRFQAIKVSSSSEDKVRVLAGLQVGERIFITPPDSVKIEGVDTVNIEL